MKTQFHSVYANQIVKIKHLSSIYNNLNRLEFLYFLQRLKGEINFSELCSNWMQDHDVTPSAISHLLNLFSKAGLVEKRKDGNKVFYTFNQGLHEKFESALKQIK